MPAELALRLVVTARLTTHAAAIVALAVGAVVTGATRGATGRTLAALTIVSAVALVTLAVA